MYLLQPSQTHYFMNILGGGVPRTEAAGPAPAAVCSLLKLFHLYQRLQQRQTAGGGPATELLTRVEVRTPNTPTPAQI